MARKFVHLLIAAAMALAGLAATSLGGPATAHADSTPAAPWIVRSGAAAPSTPVAGSEVRLLWSIDPAGTGALRDTDLGTDLAGASAPTCTPVALGPGSVIPVGGHTECSATYALTQADVDAGVVRAGWHADTLADGTGPDHAQGTIALPIAADPALSLRIDGISPAGPLAAGTTAHVQVTGTNDSGVTITDLTLAGSGRGFDTAACTPALPSALAPHASITCDVGLVLTQADVDDNPSATIALTGTTLAHGSTAARVQYRPSVTRTSALAVDTVASPGSAVVAGDTIGVTTTITNSGTMTLRRLVAADRSLGRDGLACDTPASLAPGQSLTCTGSRTATQSDVNAGAVQDAVSARASDPVGRTVVGSDAVTVGALAVDELTLAVDATPSSGLRTGQIVHYAITATNTGTLTLHGVDVSVPPTVDGLNCTPATPATLDPGDAVACDATHTVTQADVDDGTISADIATSGLNPTDDPVSDEVTSDVSADPTALLSVSGSASPSVGLAVGDTTTFTAVVTNIGARTVSGVTLTNGLTGIGPTTCTPVAGSALAPAQSMTCTATYTVTQADFDHGAVTDPMSATGTDPDGGAVTASGTGGALMGHEATIDITGAMSPDTYTGPGQVVTLGFTFTNTGDLPVHGLDIAIDLPGIGPATCTPATPATLARGGAMVCTAEYTITQADIDAAAFNIDVYALASDPLDADVVAGTRFTVTLGGGIEPTPTPGSGEPTDTVSPAVDDQTGDGQTFAFTGAESTTLALGALLAVLLGGGLVLATRRRTTGA